jgi:hypothetical protein
MRYNPYSTLYTKPSSTIPISALSITLMMMAVHWKDAEALPNIT